METPTEEKFEHSLVLEDAPIALRLIDVDKRYPGAHALKGVSLEVSRGEVHALVGENGAGKSTLVGVAAGAVNPDRGTVQIGEIRLPFADPDRCREAGLAIVYQEPALLADLTVAENMALAMPRSLRPRVGDQVRWARRILEPWAGVVFVDPTSPVRELSPDARFVVEISRAFAEDPRVLVLDEPTEHLLPTAVEKLFALMAEQVLRGTAVVYISHRLGEVKRIADRISVLRDGALIGTFEASEMSEDDIITLVAGRRIDFSKYQLSRERSVGEAATALEAVGLRGRGFGPIDLRVKQGEIVGLAGIEGQGQREFIRALAGLSPARGQIIVGERAFSSFRPPTASKAGLRYVPPDRQGEGVFKRLSVRENASVTTLAAFARMGLVSPERERRGVGQQLSALSVKTPSSETSIESLSGGNQQKVVLARTLMAAPAVILADEPTQGVDVGAREDIYQILSSAADQGSAVVVLSSSAAELKTLCDRVLVISRGRVVRELVGDAITDEAVAAAALTADHDRESSQQFKQGRSLPRTLLASDWAPAVVLAVAVMLLGLYATLDNPFYLTARNFGLLFPLFATLAFFAMAQQFVVMVGGVDLSVGPLAGLLVVVGSFSLAAYRTPTGMVLGTLIVLVIALLAGFANWCLVTLLHINPLIATLVTYIGFQGIAFTLRPLPAGRIDPVFLANVRTEWGFVPVMAAFAIVLAALLDFWLRRTRSGIRLRAVGSDSGTAARVGVSVRRMTLLAYAGCAALVMPAALLLMTQTGIGNGTIGESYTLASFAAVFLGGASIRGGRGSFVGALAGAALITQINTVVQFAGLDLYWQLWLLAVLTLIAVSFYSKIRSLLDGGAHS